ncbi:nitrilase-related carbon-nitrogen hydrolase, partial [Winogradskyella sp.]
MAQIAPVWLDKSATLRKIESYIIEASNTDCELIVFGEALL